MRHPTSESLSQRRTEAWKIQRALSSQVQVICAIDLFFKISLDPKILHTGNLDSSTNSQGIKLLKTV